MATETTRRHFGCSLKVRFGTWSYDTPDGHPPPVWTPTGPKEVKNPPDMRWMTTWAEYADPKTFDLLNDSQDHAFWDNPSGAWRWLVGNGCDPAEADRLIGEAMRNFETTDFPL
jgi:hypothetical protein